MNVVGPGPGSYKLPSEFGYYESKYARAVEEERMRKQRQRARKEGGDEDNKNSN